VHDEGLVIEQQLADAFVLERQQDALEVAIDGLGFALQKRAHFGVAPMQLDALDVAEAGARELHEEVTMHRLPLDEAAMPALGLTAQPITPGMRDASRAGEEVAPLEPLHANVRHGVQVDVAEAELFETEPQQAEPIPCRVLVLEQRAPTRVAAILGEVEDQRLASAPFREQLLAIARSL
jgi:hypothetical protein